MDNNKYITIYQYVAEKLANDNSGHDINHIIRVVKHSLKLLKKYPQANKDIVIISCLVHDVIDKKIVDDQKDALEQLHTFLNQENIANIDAIFDIILNMSYSTHKVDYFSNNLEGMIVQDSDRLDALGAFGIIRTICYGNKHNRSYDDTIFHFEEKLFLLPNLMNLDYSKDLAYELMDIMNQFYKAYHLEKTSIADILTLR